MTEHLSGSDGTIGDAEVASWSIAHQRPGRMKRGDWTGYFRVAAGSAAPIGETVDVELSDELGRVWKGRAIVQSSSVIQGTGPLEESA